MQQQQPWPWQPNSVCNESWTDFSPPRQEVTQLGQLQPQPRKDPHPTACVQPACHGHHMAPSSLVRHSPGDPVDCTWFLVISACRNAKNDQVLCFNVSVDDELSVQVCRCRLQAGLNFQTEPHWPKLALVQLKRSLQVQCSRARSINEPSSAPLCRHRIRLTCLDNLPTAGSPPLAEASPSRACPLSSQPAGSCGYCLAQHIRFRRDTACGALLTTAAPAR